MSRLILGYRDAEPSAALRKAIEEGRLGGLLWFRDALAGSVREAAASVDRLRALWPVGSRPIFAVDEEGGLIQQLGGLRDGTGEAWPRLPSPRAIGRSGDSDLAFAHGRETGRRMRAVGLDVALAPVVDLDPGPESAVLGTRCFSDDPVEVTRLALAWLRGLASAGIRGCIKHYPGHGSTRIDSHRALPRIGRNEDRARHIMPFLEIARSWRAEDGAPPALLTAHVVIGDARLPVTLDRSLLAAAPDAIGPIWTDSLDMGALAPFGDLEARARAAVDAGSDLLVIGADTEGGLAAAQRFAPPVSAKVAQWMADRGVGPLPPPWSFDEIVKTARAGFRILFDADLPAGEWDWILPRRFGPYGTVPEPQTGFAPPAARRVGRVLRYDAEEPGSLDRVLSADRRLPALVGWVHRGGIDEATQESMRRAGTRVRAIAHLLDAPRAPVIAGIWTCETCGFGEGEMAALHRLWATYRAGVGGDGPPREAFAG